MAGDEDNTSQVGENSVLKTLVYQRGQVKGQLTRLKKFIESLVGGSGVTELKKRLEKLDTIFNSFEDVQAKIEALDESEKQIEERESFETLYYALAAQGEEYIQTHTPSLQSGPSTLSNQAQHISFPQAHHIQVKLPSIDLPSFNGRYEDWLSFSETFQALIHKNETLSDIQRFHYLRSALKGDAAQVVQSLELTSSNYEVAWSLLENRYKHEKLNVQKHVRALFELPPLEKDTGSKLRQLLDGAMKHIRALKALNQPTDSWDTLLVHLVTTKLTSTLQREWELATKPDKLATFDELCNFMQRRCQVLETANTYNLSLQKPSNQSSVKYKPPIKACTMVQDSTNSYRCRICKGTHQTYQCKDLLKLSQDDQFQRLKTAGVCFNCLKAGHQAKDCFSSGCRICNKKHNTVLHPRSQTPAKTTDPNTSSQSGSEATVSVHAATDVPAAAPQSQVLLSTAVVEVVGPTGKRLKCRALLDSGSQSCFMAEHVCQQLGLKRSDSNFQVAGIDNAKVKARGGTTATVKSRVSSYSANLHFIIISKITEDIPRENIHFSRIQIPKHVALADPTFGSPGRVDLLLGQEIFFDILCIGQLKSAGLPTLQKTKLGWVAGGRFSSVTKGDLRTCLLSTAEKISTQLQDFWTLEEFADKTHLTREEEACEEIFGKSTIRGEDGRYTVTMPLKMDPHELGDSRTAAERRFTQLERRLARDANLNRQYSDFMKEYHQLNHMEKIEQNIQGDPEYFLPHHAVMKASSTTTKLRVVFDASAKTSSDLSLNDIQMVGPTVQSDIISIFLRFRTHNIVLTADIEKMYRQVNISSDQQNMLKILWRESPELPIDTYKLKTVTYGTASASFLATRTLVQLANDENCRYPRAAEVLKRDFYVDDLLTGVHTEQEATSLQQELTNLLSKGGFNLRKWSSNSKTIREKFSAAKEEDSTREFPSSHESMTVKTLGLWWDAHEDEFHFSPNQEIVNTNKSRVTKRTILSDIARLFDPLGLVGPVIIRAKMLLQDLWKLNISWDESLPMHICTEWKHLSECLNELKHVVIARQATQPKSRLQFDLQGFADASEKAYGSAVYLRHADEEGNIKVSLLCAKSRVAPLKTVSLPRLELCAALLLSELMGKVSRALNVSAEHMTYWTDSTVVLAWLKSEPSRWNTFVANRVSKIPEMTQQGDWKHVSSEDNPADIVSRGAQARTLIHSKLWWGGPAWLAAEKGAWPIVKVEDQYIEPPEARQKIVTLTATSEHSESLMDNLVKKFSKLSTLIRVVAYCLRFAHNTKTSEDERTGPLTTMELNDAKMKIIFLVQNETFKEDIKLMKSNKPISSNLQGLAPFLDPLGIIRVGGRLENSNLKYENKHPILLPKHHLLTSMIFRAEHVRHLHCGPQALLYAVRQQYWPINGRNIERKVTHECITYFKARPKLAEQQMGDLPASRVTPARAFLHCSVDYCGHSYIKQSKRRGAKLIKSYVCVFVCLATKAVHLELVSDLTTETFLAALRRFTSRRGICVEIRSDNGKNFRGANRELKELQTFFRAEASSIIDAEASEGIRWLFNPPYSPHMGGVWEAAVKSSKQLLKRTVGNASLTFEEFYTVLTQVEAVLNSRPLYPMSSDPSDLRVLTPAHFLINGPLTTIPEPSLKLIPERRLSRWQRLQQLLQHFWSRWSREYLTHLQSRGKWRLPRPSIEPGTLVLLKDDNLPPLAWPLGRVAQLHPGRDNRVRVVSVKTSAGVVSRAINKLCPLPLETDRL